MKKSYKIMFVCLGNICRSPMAELLFRDMLKKSGREKDFIVASSGTSSENVWNGVGAPVYTPVRKLLEGKGISCAEKRAQVLTAEDGETYDLIVCMDDSNLRNAKRIVGQKNAEKCRKLLADRAVADPWYTRDFNEAYEDIKQGLEILLQSLN